MSFFIHKKVLECLQKREDLFRSNHAEFAQCDGHQSIVPQGHNNGGGGEAATAETGTTGGSANPRNVSLVVPTLSRLSCQLAANAHGELLRLYPLGTPDGRVGIDLDAAGKSATRHVFEEQNEILILKQGNRLYHKSIDHKSYLEEYDPSVDAAVMLRDIEAATHASGKKVGHFKNSTIIPLTHDAERKQETLAREFHDRTYEKKQAVPSLSSLAGKAASEKILPNMRELEIAFIDKLGEAHADAKQSYKDLIERAQTDANGLIIGPEMQKVNKISSEIQEMEAQLREMRNKLFEANEAVTSKRDEINEMYHYETQLIQDDFDEKRVKIAEGYLEERGKLQNDFSSSYFGFRICKRCVAPFEPTDRLSLPGWKRCSVVGCNSADEYCLECCSNPCPRCYAPICFAHEAPHEFECIVRRPCGYQFSSDDIFVGIGAGCCGEANRNLSKCVFCYVQTCANCNVENKCPKCHLSRGQSRDESPPVRFLWKSEEYAQKRQLLGFPTSKDEARRNSKQPQRGAFRSVVRHDSWNHFLETITPMEAAEIRNSAKTELERKRKLDLGVKDRFDQFKRKRHSTSQMHLLITRPEKCRAIRDIMIPRVFASDPN